MVKSSSAILLVDSTTQIKPWIKPGPSQQGRLNLNAIHPPTPASRTSKNPIVNPYQNRPEKGPSESRLGIIVIRRLVREGFIIRELKAPIESRIPQPADLFNDIDPSTTKLDISTAAAAGTAAMSEDK